MSTRRVAIVTGAGSGIGRAIAIRLATDGLVVAVLDLNEDAADKVVNMRLGISVLNEYRCRGLGTVLLYESLRRLRERGLDQVRVVTKKGVTADRYLYPKFGSTRVVLVGVPA